MTGLGQRILTTKYTRYSCISWLKGFYPCNPRNPWILSSLLLLALLAGCGPSAPLATLTPAPPPTSTPPPTATPIAAPAGWKLAWQDEFDGPAGTQPDPQHWVYDIGNGVNGWGNAEYEYYTNGADNAALDGAGDLVITARKLDNALTSGMDCWNGPCAYTSARLLTKGKLEVTYGRVEARLKLPSGQGIWSAFWMLGADVATTAWPMCGEIDVMENIGKEPGIVHGTVHGPGYSGAQGVGGPYTLDAAKFSDDFHLFAVEWDKQEIRWYVDGKQYLAISPDKVSGDWVFNHPFFLILNLAVGGGWPGYPDATTTFPQALTVDYVRVFQRQ
ncbi:MAG TPA: glycoside hydrolase family 16 protein [Polyangia bacterium]